MSAVDVQLAARKAPRQAFTNTHPVVHPVELAVSDRALLAVEARRLQSCTLAFRQTLHGLQDTWSVLVCDAIAGQFGKLAEKFAVPDEPILLEDTIRRKRK